jgi:hypothetical protein
MNKQPGEEWDVRMGWRFVAYGEHGEWLSLQIEPMVEDPDIVYAPNESAWSQGAPPWALPRRAEILGRLKSVPWNRQLIWDESAIGTVETGRRPHETVPHSLEATPVGRLFERLRLFEPGGRVPHRISHKLWHWAARMFAQGARGEVNLFMREKAILGSVFESIEFPTLRANPYVTLKIHYVRSSDSDNDST